MKLFEVQLVRSAIEYAESGGQALHIWTPPQNKTESCWPGAPACFRKAKLWAHLIDQDELRLKKTARNLGVRKIVISRLGRSGQHVDLCGKPLLRAIEQCNIKLAETIKKGYPPGICKICGCTDDHACSGGCSWANKEHTLCTSCVKPPGGKP